MGHLFERLLSIVAAASPATPATLATLPYPNSRKVADSQVSQGGDIENARAQRARLLALTEDEGLPAGLAHGLDDADAGFCSSLPDGTLRAYLRALEARQCMAAGVVPPGWGEAVARSCEGCGPVLLWLTCPAVVKACPWCFRRNAGKAIPRPPVRCDGCRHYQRDTSNPEVGIGGCGLAVSSAFYPMQAQACPDFAPVED